MKKEKDGKAIMQEYFLQGFKGLWRKSTYDSLSEGKPFSMRDATDHCSLFPSAYFNKKKLKNYIN